MIWVDGFFNGNVVESGPGRLIVQIFGDEPSAGPGTFNGNAEEKDSGNSILWIEAPGVYNGNFEEQDEGMCYVQVEWPSQQPNGNIDCNTVEYIDW